MVARLSTVETTNLAAAFAEDAREAGLRYSNDARPGVRREMRGKNFVYFGSNGARIKDKDILARIRRLAIPPAWQNVWICAYENGHIQATGRDARGRKQYRYHADWRQRRDENKFDRMIAFAGALPRIRRRVQRDLTRRGMPREKALATVVRLLEATLIRVGNDEYARQNKSYGLTTMRNRHARVTGAEVRFNFRGKSGKHHEISVRDPQLARIVRRCQEMPGQELFGYEDELGGTHDVGSHDVNAYLREISGADLTAKDFRTWAGTVLAAIALREFEAVTHAAEAKKNVLTAIEAVAKMLGNTPAVCRKCYVHPEILDSYLAGDTIATIRQRAADKIDRSLARLKPEEAAVLVLIQERLREKNGTKPHAKAAPSRQRGQASVRRPRAGR
jgi:DNA topoisomerase-1